MNFAHPRCAAAALIGFAAFAQQPPVDYVAIQKMIKDINVSIEKQVMDDAKKLGVASTDELTARDALDSGYVELDFTKAIAPLKALAKDAKGDLLDACLIAELALRSTWRDLPRNFKLQIVEEVPPTSPAWLKTAPKTLPWLNNLLGTPGDAYVKAMRAKETAEMRAYFDMGTVYDKMEEEKLAEAKALLADIKAKFPELQGLKDVEQALTKRMALSIGGDAPDFMVPNLANEQELFTKAGFKGKYLLLDFWGTWCAPCKRAIPTLDKLYATYKDKGLEILSLASDPDVKTVNAFREENKLPMPWKHTVMGNSYNVNPVSEAYQIQSYPTFYLLGPDGKVLAGPEDLQHDKLEATVAKHLAK